MIKKKVLVQGSLKSLQEFFSSPFNREFQPLALVTDELGKVVQAVKGGGGNLLKFSRLITCRVSL